MKNSTNTETFDASVLILSLSSLSPPPKDVIIWPKKFTHNYFNITEKIKLVRVKLYILILIFSFA